MTTAPTRHSIDLSTAALADAYRSGELSPVEVATSVLDDIAHRNPTINAFTDLDPDQVIADATASQERWRRGTPRGPLDGVPVTVKENLSRIGIPAHAGTSGGTPVIPTRDAPIVERLTEDGAVIIGSTTMPDWGMLSSGVSSHSGITRSPWNPEWTVGGSSSGAGAAAAAGFGTVHIGTDIGGSVRLPAAWTGVATLKPSDGRVPLDNPYLGRAAGPLAQSIADVAAAMTSISRPDARDDTSLPAQDIDWTDLGVDVRGARIGLHVNPGAGMPVDPETRAAVERAATLFSDHGAEVVDVEPFIDEQVLADIDSFWRVRFWRTYLQLEDDVRDRVLPYIAEWVAPAADATGAQALEWYESIGAVSRATVQATLPFDAVLSPVSPVNAFPAQWPMPWGSDASVAMSHIAFTLPYNVSGQPASSINCGFSSEGKPIGLQISGRRHTDLTTLRYTAWYEQTRPADAVPHFPTS